MSSEIEHIEYDRDVNPYPSFGKKYNSERAIISLTSWKKRIGTVSKTIVNLLQMCPEFHIVLVLNTVEFPHKENDLPSDLKLLLESDLFEIIWLKKDYKVFQKVLFTMDKYRNVPIISADDDNYYKFNYAEELYNKWLKHKNSFISYYSRIYKDSVYHMGGNFTLFPPYAFKEYGIKWLNNDIIALKEDDPYYTLLRHKLKLFNRCITINKKVSDVIGYHDCIDPLLNVYRNRPKDFAIHEMEKILNEYDI
jgi:hypothetical protein